MPEANVPKVGHGLKMGQDDFDCACVSVVFTCTPLVFHSSYMKPVGLGHGSTGLFSKVSHFTNISFRHFFSRLGYFYFRIKG